MIRARNPKSTRKKKNAFEINIYNTDDGNTNFIARKAWIINGKIKKKNNIIKCLSPRKSFYLPRIKHTR
jgi:hypothetical protein